MAIPDTVAKRQFIATGRWEAVMVYDSNWGGLVQGVVAPDGRLDHTYDGFAPTHTAEDEATRLNKERYRCSTAMPG